MGRPLDRLAGRWLRRRQAGECEGPIRDRLAGWWLGRSPGEWRVLLITEADRRRIRRGIHAGRDVPLISREVDGESIPVRVQRGSHHEDVLSGTYGRPVGLPPNLPTVMLGEDPATPRIA